MTETLVREKTLTAEEFYAYCVGKEGRLELVDGKVVEMPPVNPNHGDLDSVFAGILGPFVRLHQLGRVYINTGFILRRHPDLVRGPDQAFVSAARIAANPPPERGFWPIAPDLALELVSPDDKAHEINEKVQDYLDAGVRLVWVFYPRTRQVHIFRPGAPVEVLRGDAILDGGDVLPGFQLQLESLWQ